MLFIGRGDVLGQWQCEWNYTWEQLKEPPVLTPKGIQILLKVTSAAAWLPFLVESTSFWTQSFSAVTLLLE